jgi:hypothetical protein
MAGSELMAGKSKVSTDDWTPPSGMTKRVCLNCQKPFASCGLPRCANCIAVALRRARKQADDIFLDAGQLPARPARAR